MSVTTRHRLTVDTADRLRPLDYLTHDGKRYLVADITLANLTNRRGVLAVLIVDPNGGSNRPRLLMVNPGYILEFERVPRCSTRSYAAEEYIKVRRAGLGFEVLDTITNDWVYVVPAELGYPDDSYSEASGYQLACLSEETTLAADPEMARVVTVLRSSIYQGTAERVLGTTTQVVDKAIELGLVRLVKVQSTTYNRRGERMLAAA